ncbi:MAG: hypothetical protein ACREAB_08665 [Blastocatellia bacterium]
MIPLHENAPIVAKADKQGKKLAQPKEIAVNVRSGTDKPGRRSLSLKPGIETGVAL